MRRHLILAEFLSTPLALLPERILTVYQVLTRWDAGMPIPPEVRAKVEEDKSARTARRQDMQSSSQGALAVLPLMGMLVQHPVEDISGPGATSIDQWGAQFQALVEDPMIAKIIVPMEGPGGSIYGIMENADLIYNARQTKPVIGIANSYAASAHYWLLSQMSEAWVTPGGEVGSIGVRAAITSIAEALKANGYDIRVITSSPYKAEGDPSLPITDDAIADLTARVDDYGRIFEAHVARGRGVSPDYVKAHMGQGRMLSAEAAMAHKMVDGISTFRDLIARHAATSVGQTATKAGSRRRASAALDIARLSQC